MHNIEYRTYNEKVDKDNVKKDIDHFVAMEDWREGCSGLYHGIRWIDMTFASYDDAQGYIEDHDRGDYDNLAVKYRVADNDILKIKKYKELKERNDRLWREYSDMANASYMAGVKSLLVTCSKCGSKISSRHWKRNNCPVCGEDFRSKTTLDRINAKLMSFKKAEAEMEKYKADYAEKHGKVYWLVKFEYHT